MAQTCIWIVILPLIAFVIQAFFGKRLPRQGDWVSVAGIFGSFILAVPIFWPVLMGEGVSDSLTYTWISLPLPGEAGNFNVDIGILVNNLTAIMLFMVTLCASLIHLFSTGYMHGEERYHLFFAYISLFSSAMLGLVISNNLLTFFICWELMGLCSYLLIGFYYKKYSAINASLKAFMTTRVGDVCFFLGLCGIYYIFGTFNFTTIYEGVASGQYAEASILGVPAFAFIGFMILLGAIGKSAQFPLQVWLPDAMEGPTPVSALIHAATMVAAGIFLLVRTYPLLDASHLVLTYAAYVGAATAFLAALLALVQFDIKKVLAYSTISQLGYMMMGIGVGAFGAAFLHCITHAFFKACLFMGSGSVIHSVHTQDMREMGGLKSKMPITFLTMFIATLAISGVPFFSGFVSKDRILAGALGYGMDHGQHLLIPILGFAAAALTAFYMFRLVYMTFFGAARDEKRHHHAHEQPFNMTLPLIVLAALSLAIWFAGPTGIHAADSFFEVHWFDDAIKQVETESKIVPHESESHHAAHTIALVLSLILAFGGIFLSTLTYLKKAISAEAIQKRFSALHTVLVNKYYFDDFYIGVLIKKGLLTWNVVVAKFDDIVVDGIAVDGWAKLSMWIKSVVGKIDDIIVDRLLVDGTGYVSAAGGWVLRRFQTGQVQHYLVLAMIVLGIIFVYLN